MATPVSIRPAVAAIIFNSRGEVLLQKRRDVNLWGLISGHVEFGESVEEAIIREIREETGAAARIKRLIGVYSSPRSQTYTYTHGKVQYVTTYFEAELLQPLQPGYSNEETAALRYFPPGALPPGLAQVNEFWLHDALSSGEQVFIR